MPPDETLALAAVVIPLVTCGSLLALLVIAVLVWWRASAAAEREWRESERIATRSRGDVLTAIGKSRHRKA